ncbi:unnamed protein product [Toxocara canis]|uniref:CACTA en-spm transposon protein n=1 Tax=Toxocara canis TaxID=6265 RepID=A0A183U223_TOXCA|nr:unnamed protein product [Toxocara canis]
MCHSLYVQVNGAGEGIIADFNFRTFIIVVRKGYLCHYLAFWNDGRFGEILQAFEYVYSSFDGELKAAKRRAINIKDKVRVYLTPPLVEVGQVELDVGVVVCTSLRLDAKASWLSARSSTSHQFYNSSGRRVIWVPLVPCVT